MSDSPPAPDARRPWRQAAFITAGALALYLGFRLMPTGTNLHHLDFRVEGGSVLEFCDPANPQFVPVVAVRSPVVTELRADSAPAVGVESRFTLRLKTATGKPIGPDDLAVMHTRKLHLLVVDPTLADYQHVHPEPGPTVGEWAFSLTPHRGGLYRVFADFTPVATGRSLYASAEFEAKPGADPVVNAEAAVTTAWEAVADGYVFRLTPDALPIRTGVPVGFTFEVRRTDGGPVRMERVMDAYAHLVAFDRERSGFAHLHPDELAGTPAPESGDVRLAFKITIPRAGPYVIWAQVKLAGQERFVPFRFEVDP